jgi:hypothetical protein
MTKKLALVLTAAFAVLVARPGAAITDEEVFRTFRFNFVNPGGRAGAMGGAFVGIADDATAAAANPAGLTNLIAPEFFVELRLDDPDPTKIRAFVDDPRGGPDPVLTASKGGPDSMLFPSFISWVKPFKHWVLGISRQEVLNTQLTATNLFTDEPAFPVTEIVRADGQMDALLEHYNVSAAFSAGDKVAIGATVSYARLDVESKTTNYFNFGSSLAPDYATAVNDSDQDLTWSLGLLIHAHEKLDIGLVYRAGARFDLQEDILDIRPPGNYPSAPILADFLGNRNLSVKAGEPFGINRAAFDDPMTFKNEFNVPDQAGIGFGFQPTSKWTVAADVVWVQYSDLETNMVGNVNALTFPGDPPTCDFAHPNPDGSFPCVYATPEAKYKFDNEVIYHLGMEYAWTIKEKVPFFFRMGWYNDPNVRMQADFPKDGVFIADSETFPAGDSASRYTIGFGFVMQDKFQADFAADLSRLSYTYTASFIYHF